METKETLENRSVLETLIDMSLDSWQDAEIGDCSESPFEWAALFYFSPADATGVLEGLTGAILFCNSQGFYSYSGHIDRRNLFTEWEETVRDLAVEEDEVEHG